MGPTDDRLTPEAEKATADMEQRFKRRLEPFGFTVKREVKRSEFGGPCSCEYRFQFESNGFLYTQTCVLDAFRLAHSSPDDFQHFVEEKSRHAVVDLMLAIEEKGLASLREREWKAAADWLLQRAPSNLIHVARDIASAMMNAARNK